MIFQMEQKFLSVNYNFRSKELSMYLKYMELGKEE